MCSSAPARSTTSRSASSRASSAATPTQFSTWSTSAPTPTACACCSCAIRGARASGKETGATRRPAGASGPTSPRRGQQAVARRRRALLDPAARLPPAFPHRRSLPREERAAEGAQRAQGADRGGECRRRRGGGRRRRLAGRDPGRGARAPRPRRPRRRSPSPRRSHKKKKPSADVPGPRDLN